MYLACTKKRNLVCWTGNLFRSRRLVMQNQKMFSKNQVRKRHVYYKLIAVLDDISIHYSASNSDKFIEVNNRLRLKSLYIHNYKQGIIAKLSVSVYF